MDRLKARHHHIKTNGINLHVVDAGQGTPVFLLHGFPAIWSSWRAQIDGLSQAGYRVLVPDMRGYGESDTPQAPDLYTPFHTVGDLIGVLDHLDIERSALVGHDFGADIAWNAALMRPDRFSAVFSISIPFHPHGWPHFLGKVRTAGALDFYMFRQMQPEADAEWSDAKTTIPAMYHWTSGYASLDERWDPFDPQKGFLRPAPGPIGWASDYIDDAIAAFARTGFHGPLNYYRAIDTFLDVASGVFAGAIVRQPSAILMGELDGLNALGLPDEQNSKPFLPNLREYAILEGVGHWPQLEAPEAVNNHLLAFLKSLE